MTPQHHTSHPEYHSMTGSTLTAQQQDTMANIAQKRIRGFFLIAFGSFMAVAALLALFMGLTSPDSPGMQSDLPVPPVILWFTGLLIVSLLLVVWGARRLKSANRQRRTFEEALTLPGQG